MSRGAGKGWNAWDHFLDHVRAKGDVPSGIDDVVTYVQKARGLAETPPPGALSGTRLKGADLERVVFKEATGEFAVMKLTGGEAGAVKSYYVPEGDTAARLSYFLKEIDAATLVRH